MRASLIVCCLILAAPASAQPAQAKFPAGEWHGTGVQVGPEGVHSSWTINLSIGADNRGAISYPSLGCKAKLHRLANSRNQIRFREEITEGDCIDGGEMTAILRHGRLFWFWTSPDTPADASAVLYQDNQIS